MTLVQNSKVQCCGIFRHCTVATLHCRKKCTDFHLFHNSTNDSNVSDATSLGLAHLPKNDYLNREQFKIVEGILNNL